MSDLISRQAAIEALGEAPKFKIGLLKKYAEGRNDQWFDDVAALVKLPSAQPERKKGRWILVSDGYTDYVKCDMCGEVLEVEKNFYPNCGARMEGTE